MSSTDEIRKYITLVEQLQSNDKQQINEFDLFGATAAAAELLSVLKHAFDFFKDYKKLGRFKNQIKNHMLKHPHISVSELVKYLENGLEQAHNIGIINSHEYENKKEQILKFINSKQFKEIYDEIKQDIT